MLTDQKLKEILKYVWNPTIDLTNANDIENLNQLIQQIYTLLESRHSSVESLSEFLITTSIQCFNSEVMEEKSVHAAKLIMDWHIPIPSRWTDYGRVKIQISPSRFFDQDYFVYHSDAVTKYIRRYYIAQNEIVICPEEIDLSEVEKAQLIDAIRDLIKPSVLTFFDPETHPNIMRSTLYE